MALPTPLHPAQAESTAIKAEFNTGPHDGLVLLVAKNDPNLAGAIASGEVVVPGPFPPPPPVGPAITGMSPLTGVIDTSVPVVITGIDIPATAMIDTNLSFTLGVITPTQITGTIDLTGESAKTENFGIFGKGSDPAPLRIFEFVVTAS